MVEATAQALVRYIATHKLRPGDQLPSERELVTMTGVSRLPLREALSILKGLGVIEARHGKGVFVRRLDMAALFGMLSPLLRTHADIDVKHIAQVRMHLEAAIAELAAGNRTDDNLRALQAAVTGMNDSLLDRQSFIVHDMVFHQELARSTGNPIFEVLMAAIGDLFRELQHLYRDRVAIRQKAIREHVRVLDAVRQRDAARAGSAMQEHIAKAEKRM